MTISVKIYDNGDHTALIWLPEESKPIHSCRGFAVKRNCDGKESFLKNAIGFADGEQPPADNWKWPIQRYIWWDYDVNPGNAVKYQVIPVLGDSKNLQLDTEGASKWTDSLTVSGQCTEHISAYFNRGIVASRWVSRVLDAEKAQSQGQARQTALKQIIAEKGNQLRNALSGLLRVELLQLLEKAKGKKLYAALYELNDPELMEALIAMKGDASIILANGAFSSKEPDENAEARTKLKSAGVNVYDRMVKSGHFAHNKFVVFCDAHGNPSQVLTGSTNWTDTGLCTQANNSLIINDAAVAARYHQQWETLKAAGNDFPKMLVAANSKEKQFSVDGMTVTPWFSPEDKAESIQYARKLIAGAKEGILFLFFNPGTYQEDPEKETLLQDVLERHKQGSANYNADLYIRGVVNQEIAGLTNSGGTERKGTAAPPHNGRLGSTPVALYNGGKQDPQTFTKDILIPAAIKQRFHDWEAEARGASMVMVHSKVIVIDPFGKNPVLMTGSDNLGLKASQMNDDNLVILEGERAAPLAAAYAVNIIGIYQEYRWNAYVTAHAIYPKTWHGLEDNDAWQTGHLQGDALAELEFWMAVESKAAGVKASSAAPGAGQ